MPDPRLDWRDPTRFSRMRAIVDSIEADRPTRWDGVLQLVAWAFMVAAGVTIALGALGW